MINTVNTVLSVLNVSVCQSSRTLVNTTFNKYYTGIQTKKRTKQDTGKTRTRIIINKDIIIMIIII